MSAVETLMDMFGSSSEKEVLEIPVGSGQDELILGGSKGKVEQLKLKQWEMIENLDEPAHGRLQKMMKQMEKEKKGLQKRQQEMLEGGVVGQKGKKGQKDLGANRVRVNKNLILETNQKLIPAVLDLQQKSGDEALDAFWLIDHIAPFKISERVDGKGKLRTDRELTRVINTIKSDIKKLERGQLKRGRTIARQKKLGDFTLFYRPVKDNVEKKQDEIVVKVPGVARTKKFAYFQNFDIPPPPLSSKVNPWSKKEPRWMKIKGNTELKLSDLVDSHLRDISKEVLFNSLQEVKGLNQRDEEEKEEEVRNIGANKNDFIRQKVKEFIAAGELEYLRDEVGLQILSDYLADANPLSRAAIIAYQFRRLDPRIITKDTLLDHYNNIMSYGLINHLGQKGKESRGAVEEGIFRELERTPLDASYKYILNVGLHPMVIDEFGQERPLIAPAGFDVELLSFIANYLHQNEFSEADLREFFVGKEQERISQEQWDLINSEWEVYKVQFDDLADYDSALSSEGLDIQSVGDLLSARVSLRNEVDVLEQGIYNNSKNIREYVLQVATILAVLDMETANNVKNRLNTGAVSVDHLHLLSVEELLPELFMNEELRGGKAFDIIEMDKSSSKEILEIRGFGARFKKWLNRKINAKAKDIMHTYQPLNLAEWFPVGTHAVKFNAEKFVVPEAKLCGELNSNKYYVMTEDGIQCMTASQIKKQMKELEKHNRKDLQKMIEE